MKPSTNPGRFTVYVEPAHPSSGSSGFLGSANPSAQSTASFSGGSTFTNTTSLPADFYLSISTNSSAAVASSEVDIVTDDPYVPNSGCKPGYYNTAGWTSGTPKTVAIASSGAGSFEVEDRDEIVQAVLDWNTKLAALGINVSYQPIDSSTGDIVVRSSSDISGGGVHVYQGPGQGYIYIATSHLELGLSNLVWNIALHELGHVLRLKDLNPSEAPYNTVTPACTRWDALMFHAIDVTGPFPPITQNEEAALNEIYNP